MVALAAWTERPAAADVHEIAESATADCDAIDAWIEAPQPDATVVLDVVAMPVSPRYPTALQTSNADGGLWEGTKWGLLFRNGASPFSVIVPKEVRDRVFIWDWGTETNTWEVHVPGCERTEEWIDNWLIFGGGVVVREPECVPLRVTRGSQVEKVMIGIGAPCPGQDPPPEPIGPNP